MIFFFLSISTTINIIAVGSEIMYQYLLPQNIEIVDKQYTCIKAFLEETRDERSIFLYSNIIDTLDKLGYLITRLGAHIRNFDMPNHLQFGRFTYYAFLLTNKVNHIRDYFNAMMDSRTFQSDTKYFIVYLGDESLNEIFAITWLVYTERIIVMDKYLNFYTSEPYEIHCGVDNRFDYLFNCNTMDFEKIFEIFNFTYTTFHGCKVKVLVLEKPPFVINASDVKNPGVEIEIFNMAATRYNFTPLYIPNNNVTWGERLPDGNFTNMIKKLHDRDGDVLFGNVYTNSSFTEDFQCSYPYLQSDLAFFLPNEPLRKNWQAGIEVFELAVWLVTIVMIITIHASLALFSYTLKKMEINSLRYSFLGTWGIFLGKAGRQPRVTILRFLFIICVLCTYIINFSYETRLLSVLIKPKISHIIKTDSDVIASGMRLGGLRFAKDLFSKPNSQLYKRYVNCGMSTACLNRTAFHKDLATIDNTMYTKYFMTYYVDKNGFQLLRQLKSSYSFFSWIMMNKGFPILPLINDTIMYLCDHGFMSRMFRESIKFVPVSKEEVSHTLDLGEMVLYFYILIIGLVLSAIAFLCEVKFKNYYVIFN